MQLIVTVQLLNKRKTIPAVFTEQNIIGTVNRGFCFEGEEITPVPNPLLGKWFKDRDGYFYWGGGVVTMQEQKATGKTIAVNNTNPNNTI
jgi:hypothetical protein